MKLLFQVVPGWEPDKDRNVSRYIRPLENTFLHGKDHFMIFMIQQIKIDLFPDLSCLNLTSVKVLIFIQSSPALLERRSADRQTWMKYQEQFPMVL